MNRNNLLWAAVAALIIFAIVFRYNTVTEQDCIDTHLHNVGIIAGDPEIPDELKEIMLKSVVNKKIAPGVLDACLKRKTKKQLRCEMNASSYNDLRDCMQNKEK